MQVIIEKIVYPGRRMASREGKVIFTDEGLPGELVEVETVREKKNFIEARTVRIIRESGRRVEARCGHFLACSSYQSMAYADQIELKKSQLGEILGGVIDLGKSGIELVPSPDIWHYRNKVRYHIIWPAGRARLAYSVPGSRNAFVEVDECYLVTGAVSEIMKSLLKIIDENKLGSLQEVEAKESRASGELLLNLHWSSPSEPKILDPILSGLLTRFPLAGIVSFTRKGKAYHETLEWGRNFIEEKIGETAFEVGARSFFQINVGIMDRVLRDMKDLARFKGTERLADLFCGLGTFGLALAREVKEVWGVESDPANILFLKKNIERNGAANFKIFEGTSEEWAPMIFEKKLETVIFDPPRKGLGPEIVQALLDHPTETMIYLSCNPTTQARDLKDLGPAYEIKAFRAYDFFPQTPHIETLAVLSRR
ncbi:MAG: 23S rRNA (uracil(1939)-C(5))-methyltransferase RlmD [Candidatus Aminicenantales bacterium]